jgi:hypothetical protein
MSESNNEFDEFDYAAQGQGPQVYWHHTDTFPGDFHPDSVTDGSWMSQDRYNHPAQDADDEDDAPDISGPADLQGVYGQLVNSVQVSLS